MSSAKRFEDLKMVFKNVHPRILVVRVFQSRSSLYRLIILVILKEKDIYTGAKIMEKYLMKHIVTLYLTKRGIHIVGKILLEILR